MAANFASNLGFELSVEEVYHDGLISQDVVLPSLGCDYYIRATQAVFQLDVGLVCYTVEIFVKAIKKKGQKLLRVLLLEAGKVRSISAREIFFIS